MSDVKQFVWYEKYRPNTLDECILPESLKTAFSGYVEQGKVPTLLLCGSAGTGKTTAAKAMCNEIGADCIVINCSVDNGIDILRTRVQQFASTVSFTEAKKVVILDEADYLTHNAQAGFRGMIEEFAHNCSFIFTCNFKDRIIEPIHSRCAVFDFKAPKDETPKLAAGFFKRVCYILDVEQVEYDKKAVAELVNQYFPDFRRTLNELQRYSVIGKIDSGILIKSRGEYAPMLAALKAKNFGDLRKWVAQNEDMDVSRFYTDLYPMMCEELQPKSIPEAITIMADHAYRAAFVACQQVNTMDCLMLIMVNCQFK